MDWNDPNDLMELAYTFVPAGVAFLITRGASRPDAEDACAYAVLAARKSRARCVAELRAFFNRCAYNEYLDLCTAGPSPDVLGRLVGTERTVQLNPAEIHDEATLRRIIARAVDLLPRRQREAVLLRSDGASVQEIADKQGGTYKATESAIARGYAALRAHVESACAGIAALLRPGAARRVALAAVPGVSLFVGAFVPTGPSPHPGQSAAPVALAPKAPAAQVRRPALAPSSPSMPSPSPTPSRLSSALLLDLLPAAVPPRSTKPPRSGAPDDVNKTEAPDDAPLAERIVYCVTHVVVSTSVGCPPPQDAAGS